jgi:hypothetical protein
MSPGAKARWFRGHGRAKPERLAYLEAKANTEILSCAQNDERVW